MQLCNAFRSGDTEALYVCSYTATTLLHPASSVYLGCCWRQICLWTNTQLPLVPNAFSSCGSCAVYVAHLTTTPSLRSSMPLLRVAWTTVVVYSSAHWRKRRTSYSGSSTLQCVWCQTLESMTEAWRTFGVTFCTGWMSLITSVSESASRCSSVFMGWHQTTCLLCATLHPDSLDTSIFALRIADSSTFHALHCRRAVFEPSHIAGPSLWNTLPVHLKNRNLTLTTFMRHLKSYLFSQYWFRIERIWGVIT